MIKDNTLGLLFFLSFLTVIGFVAYDNLHEAGLTKKAVAYAEKEKDMVCIADLPSVGSTICLDALGRTKEICLFTSNFHQCCDKNTLGDPVCTDIRDRLELE